MIRGVKTQQLRSLVVSVLVVSVVLVAIVSVRIRSASLKLRYKQPDAKHTFPAW